MDNNEEIRRSEDAVHIAALIYKIQEKEALTDEEQQELDAWVRENKDHAALYERLMDRRGRMSELKGLEEFDTAKAVRAIFDQTGLAPVRQTGRVFFSRRWLSAAAVFLLIIMGTWLFVFRRSVPVHTPSSSKVVRNDIPPGGNKAVLILADGTQIKLDSASNGQLALQGQANVVKQDNGLLTYHLSGENKPGEIFWNTIEVPRGGQYRLVLSDGSKVWLNAASSIRYPSTFTGKERSVEITGEAYFEVEKNTAMPFVVKVSDTRVEVLGTHFNIMAYSDEADVRTTLLEGAVRVRKGDAALLLTPGQQARVGEGGKIKLIGDADADDVLAWKNNLFSFNDDDIATVMRQVARWYDVDIKYEGQVTQHFSGNISRKVNVSQLFKMLELTGTVHFKIEGNYILVTN
ncbi:MAG: FecR domain-containing protein [Chitinophagaceae bacterium]|nr:FecR domain-containing protein [Chitinophagaceae bacterium]